MAVRLVRHRVCPLECAGKGRWYDGRGLFALVGCAYAPPTMSGDVTCCDTVAAQSVCCATLKQQPATPVFHAYPYDATWAWLSKHGR